MASLFERAVSTLFGSSAKPNAVDQQLIQEMTDGFVETVEPRVRLSSRYREKLAGNVARTISHLRALAARLPLESIVLSPGAWSEDPRVRAFFAAAADVSTCIGRSDEVRESPRFQAVGALRAVPPGQFRAVGVISNSQATAVE